MEEVCLIMVYSRKIDCGQGRDVPFSPSKVCFSKALQLLMLPMTIDIQGGDILNPRRSSLKLVSVLQQG